MNDPTNGVPVALSTRHQTQVRELKRLESSTKIDNDSEHTCRICLDDQGTLIRPCLCRGSIAFVHRECLNKWRRMGNNAEAHSRCGTCKFDYHFEGIYSRLKPHLNKISWAIAIPIVVFIIIGSGYLVKGFEIAFSSPEPPISMAAFYSIDELHIIYGVLLPAAIGLGPFAAFLNIGAPTVIVYCFEKRISLDMQTLLEVAHTAIGTTVGLVRLTWRIQSSIHNLLTLALSWSCRIADIGSFVEDNFTKRHID